MKFESINPYTLDVLHEYESISDSELQQKLETAADTFKTWRQTSFESRAALMRGAAHVLRDDKEGLARTITLEMGKSLKESIAEVEKCSWACDYYAENAAAFLADDVIETDATKSYVRYDPLGTILAIMPWNFPFWQVFRFAAPALMAGNVCVLKHASNVLGCALLIEKVFSKAGFPVGAFQTLIVDKDQVSSLVKNPTIKAVTLTGSEGAGASVASQAGKNIKKTVLELGGSNAFIVLPDADLKAAVEVGVRARMQNAGQSCIAAKRFILHRDIAEEYIQKFSEHAAKLKVGNPMDPETDMGPLARTDLADQLEEQVNQSVEAGARIVFGGTRKDNFYYPTLLREVQPGMPAFDEELFGPVAAVTIANDDEDALRLANTSTFGLGISVFTRSRDRAQVFIEGSEDGAVFINGLVKSDPRLPFGGTKRSGYGRELSSQGIREFVNVKTVWEGTAL
ncbi:MAG TPA: NAD-dependent succinate-semialdehyde dehydrogenase [Cyclobacteriaceae bacterium]|jgi:succinate-semialdehyde dehydrogenase/glutarate-semialdehyde dehydrogenase